MSSIQKSTKRIIPSENSQQSRAFTLIELLVVIAIIGILSSVVLASLSPARAKARDARRISDMKQYQIALELYYSSNNAYPACADWLDFTCLQTALQNGYMQNPPQGPGFVSGDAGQFTPDSGYHFDRWCRDAPTGQNAHRYRLWTSTENPHNGLTLNWWNNNFVGATTCTDPS